MPATMRHKVRKWLPIDLCNKIVSIYHQFIYANHQSLPLLRAQSFEVERWTKAGSHLAAVDWPTGGQHEMSRQILNPFISTQLRDHAFKLFIPAEKKNRIFQVHPSSRRKLILSESQQRVFDFATSPPRPSFFFTGAAGTGKSILLNRIISELNCQNKALGLKGKNRIAVTAPTGIAASHLLGTTLHSWSGIDFHSIPLFPLTDAIDPNSIITAYVLDQLRANTYALQRWRQVHTLIIDECSMLHPSFLNLLDCIARILRLRGNLQKEVRKLHAAPFGGIQVILCGDFLQLPPVMGELNNNLVPVHSTDSCSTPLLLSPTNNVSLSFQKLLLQQPQVSPPLFPLSHFPIESQSCPQTMQPPPMLENNIIDQVKSPAILSSTLFCFDAASFSSIVDPLVHEKEIVPRPALRKNFFELDTVFRQSKDPLFMSLLDYLRKGLYLTVEGLQLFPVVDALIRYLDIPFDDRRPTDPIFAKKFTTLPDLISSIRCVDSNASFSGAYPDGWIDTRLLSIESFPVC